MNPLLSRYGFEAAITVLSAKKDDFSIKKHKHSDDDFIYCCIICQRKRFSFYIKPSSGYLNMWCEFYSKLFLFTKWKEKMKF